MFFEKRAIEKYKNYGVKDDIDFLDLFQKLDTVQGFLYLLQKFYQKAYFGKFGFSKK